MKRYLCPTHAHQMKDKPVVLSAECTICRWNNRRWTLKDVAVELRDVAESMEFAYEDEYYDPFGITYVQPFETVIKGFLRSIHPDYRKNFLSNLKDTE